MDTMNPGCFINGQWLEARGQVLISTNPADGREVVWRGHSAARDRIDDAMAAARAAFPAWSALSPDERFAILETYARKLAEAKDDVARLISTENGKPLWESRGEVQAMINKVAISRRAYDERCPSLQTAAGNGERVLYYRPHGVVAVLGPFNFPGHLPNGHIVPALLAGNTVVYKPSEWTPAVACRMVELLEESGLPPGVLNLICGDRVTGEILLERQDLNGIFFTGSCKGGQQIHHEFAGRTETILALEMGGNNPLIVSECADRSAVIYTILMSAFVSTGQRCTCARRLVVIETPQTRELLKAVCDAASQLRRGPFTDDPEPFMGPLISSAAAARAVSQTSSLQAGGGTWLLPMKRLGDGAAFVSPGIMDVTYATKRVDEEIFAPFLQVIRVPNMDAALVEANKTRFGLSAGLLSDDPGEYDQFARCIRAGIVNWNTPTTGASSEAPFGGAGQSGNHRPSAYFAADYCAWPVAGQTQPAPVWPESPPPGFPGMA